MLRKSLACIVVLVLAASSGALAADVTFTEDVAPILQENCQECHRPGEPVPMSLLDYEDARPWAKSIERMVTSRKMPPWHAHPSVGDFSNERRLSEQEIETLVAWVRAGAPKGDPAHMPEPVEFETGWRIGEPDFVFTMPVEQVLPPELEDEYRYVVIPTMFEQDRWIQAAEVDPGNLDVVHHVITFTAKMEDLVQGGPQGANLGTSLGGYAPGMDPFILPEGEAMHLPAGSVIVLQMHYHKEPGTEERDRTRIGVKWATSEVEKAMRIGVVGTEDFEIPPGATNHEVTARSTVERDITMQEIMPHMHLRGKDMRVWARFPDGREEGLVWVPEYDFNWQTFYRFAEPVKIPAGTQLFVEAHYDNSESNPFNPDPTATVTFGLPTTAEMMFAFYIYTVDGESLGAVDPGDVKPKTIEPPQQTGGSL